MAAEIGAGLVLNVLFWTVAVLVAVGLASLAVIEYFPGREPRETGVRRAAKERPPAKPSTGEDEAREEYRKAS